MGSFIKFLLLTCCATAAVAAPLFANCPRCIEIREKNKSLKNEFFYYEDYVESQKQTQAQ